MNRLEHKLEEQINPLETLDQETIVHIYNNAHRLYTQYLRLADHFTRIRQSRQIKPREFSIEYRKFFGQERKQTEYDSDMIAVSFLVKKFNGSRFVSSAEELQEIAKSVMDEATQKLLADPVKDIIPTQDLEDFEYRPVINTLPGVHKTAGETRRKISGVHDSSPWLGDEEPDKAIGE